MGLRQDSVKTGLKTGFSKDCMCGKVEKIGNAACEKEELLCLSVTFYFVRKGKLDK